MAYVYRVETVSENWLVYENWDTETRKAKRFKKADCIGVRRCHADAVARGMAPSVSFVWRTLSPASNTPKRHERVVHITRIGDGWRDLPGNCDDPYGWPAMACVDVALSRMLAQATGADPEDARRRVQTCLRWRYRIPVVVTLSDAPAHEYRLELQDGSVVWTGHEYVLDRLVPEVERRLCHPLDFGNEAEFESEVAA